MSWNNLDLKCALVAQTIVNQTGGKEYRTALNSLCSQCVAVLSEHGLYACFLYLLSPKEKDRELAKKLREGIYRLLIEVFADPLQKHRELDKLSVLSGIRKLSEDLNSLLLAKRLSDQVITYTRYHAKGITEPV